MKDINRRLRSAQLESRGKEIFEITPIILGGSPTDQANKVLLNRDDHIKAVVYWNKIIQELRQNQKKTNSSGHYFLNERT